jgi:hypothetical protein
MLRHKKLFWIGSLVAALAFDFLFWKKPLGISFFIWTAVLLLVGFLLAWGEGKKPAAVSWALSLLVLGFAFVPAWRSEPFTRFISVVMALAGMLLLTATFLNGDWPFYRIVDYITGLAKAFAGGASGAVLWGSRFRTPPPVGEEPQQKPRRGWAVVRGLLIALPLVTLFALLLSSADPVFADWLKKVFDLEKLPEYLFRLWYILMIGAFLVGIYLHAIAPRWETKKPETMKAWMKPFLGATETGIILGAIDLLFIAFVVIQVRYLFGGVANISETGYTFAEYARRGFGELVAVAVLSLMLYLGLNTISKRESKAAEITFSVVSLLLMALVLVMLASSLQRLMLYEGAYGFSQLRTYTHVFIYWLAGLILVAMALELLRKRGRFALVLLFAVVGFAASLAIINVDAFVTRQNVARAVQGEDLDFNYLLRLSDDAVPAIYAEFQQPGLPAAARDTLGATLACRAALLAAEEQTPWQGFSFSAGAAQRILTGHAADWKAYPVTDSDERGPMVSFGGKEISCYTGYDFMD